MQEHSALLGIVAALTVGVVSPGPSFVMIARTAVAASRVDGLAAALGMGAGGMVFATAALLGLHGLLLAVPALYVALKVAGGLYLVYLGVRIFRAARQPLAVDTGVATGGTVRRARAFALGFATQISNPKTAIVYASVFAAFLPATTTIAFNVSLVALVFAVESSWYALVACALSSEAPRNAYLRYKAWIDRLAGGVMVALGLKLITSVHRP
jgi:threonine/homoserine/homoserine lactone efflux protein